MNARQFNMWENASEAGFASAGSAIRQKSSGRKGMVMSFQEMGSEMMFEVRWFNNNQVGIMKASEMEQA